MPRCDDRLKVTVDGNCEVCPDYTTVICDTDDLSNSCDLTKCSMPTCADREIVTKEA